MEALAEWLECAHPQKMQVRSASISSRSSRTCCVGSASQYRWNLLLRSGQYSVHSVRFFTYPSRAMGVRVHSGPISSLHGGRQSKIVNPRGVSRQPRRAARRDAPVASSRAPTSAPGSAVQLWNHRASSGLTGLAEPDAAANGREVGRLRFIAGCESELGLMAQNSGPVVRLGGRWASSCTMT